MDKMLLSGEQQEKMKRQESFFTWLDNEDDQNLRWEVYKQMREYILRLAHDFGQDD